MSDATHTGEILARLAESTYILPKDGFRAELSPALVDELLKKMREYDLALNECEKLSRAWIGLQAAATEINGKLQIENERDVQGLIDLFAAAGADLPAYHGLALTEGYSRVLRGIAVLASARRPEATYRAERAQGERLIAAAHVLDEVARQRENWARVLMGPLVEFERGGEFLERDNGAALTATARLRRWAGEMLSAGVALVQRAGEWEQGAKEARRAGGPLPPGEFNRDAGARFEWLFVRLQEMLNESGGEPSAA